MKTPKVTPAQLSDKEKAQLAACVEEIERSQSNGAESFRRRVLACYQIQFGKLYRDTHRTEAEFFKDRFGFNRTHGLRLAKMGRIVERMSPAGDLQSLLSSDAHMRPLLTLTEAQQDAALALARAWAEMAALKTVSAKQIQAAVTYLNPPTEAKDLTNSAEAKLAAKFHQAVVAGKLELPADVDEGIVKVFDKLGKKALALGKPRRKTGVEWAETSWQTMVGCTPCSAGCEHCYAAKLVATRLADVYPGLAQQAAKAGEKTFCFNGKIQLLPEQLDAPLLDRVPKRYFVNSLSDVFHKDVPEEFINSLFHVMEAAHWHTFILTTKRPERMAAYTQKRYGAKEPASNIWLGASVENQAAYDERIKHLRETKAAVRWLSVEPLIGPVDLGDLTGIGWVVVGGESGSDRRMEKAWVTAIRGQCTEAKVPFFFKQWGDFDENGLKLKRKPKKDGLTPTATLDGVVHDAYPVPADDENEEELAAA